MSLHRIFRFNDMPNMHIKESGVSNTYTIAVPKYFILLFYSCFMWQVIFLLQTLFLSHKKLRTRTRLRCCFVSFRRRVIEIAHTFDNWLNKTEYINFILPCLVLYRLIQVPLSAFYPRSDLYCYCSVASEIFIFSLVHIHTKLFFCKSCTLAMISIRYDLILIIL